MQQLIANVNQGNPSVGEIIDAAKLHTMFFGDVFGAPRSIHTPQLRAKLRQVGGFTVEVGCIVKMNQCRYAELTPVAPVDEERLRTAATIITRCEFFGELGMSLPPGSIVEEGFYFSVGYLSVLSPLGEGTYRLLHDYPLSATSPRHEIVEQEHYE